MLALHGTADRMCPFPSLAEFARGLNEAGDICRVEAFEGRPHFFLWQSREDRAKALERTVAFLDSLGFTEPARAPSRR
jgi:dipeptidyl aminopeptidase/acylaminoacyl peptidase